MRFALLLAALAGVPAWGQAPTAEITTKEAAPTFKSGTNLVPVPVVVRDRNGRAIGNLGIEDFELFDNGKPQMISKFSVEKLAKDSATSAPTAPAGSQPIGAGGATPADLSSDGIPTRFVAYLFDDLHLDPGDLKHTVDAARTQIDAAPHTQRMAIYTTSGLVMQEFAADRDKLHAALATMGTGHASLTNTLQKTSCPIMGYYMGNLIHEKGDGQALSVATADAVRCSGAPPPVAQTLATEAARRADLQGDKDTASSLDQLRNVVAKMASMPGQRTLVLVSDGFFVTENRLPEQTGLIERAIRANVVIGTLDARGNFQTSEPDAMEDANPRTLAQRTVYRNAEATFDGQVLSALADGTGGNYYHGLNDYHEGIERTAAAPDYLYVLGFSPVDLKLDGKYHNLKVVLKTVKGMDIQSRKGYYAPQYGTNPAEQAKQQIEESFFSRDEVHDVPAVLQTQYFKDDSGNVTLSTIAKIDIRKLPFRKDAGRNDDDLTVVTGLFDNDGNYVTGMQKIVQMKLLDATIEKLGGSGISLKNSFAVHTGRYMVRMVVRDSEGELMSAQSGLVEIP
jgi:VWFA-related protein